MKYMSSDERQFYLNQLTEAQKSVLERYHKEEKSTLLQNQIFGESDEWEFKDIEVSAHYRDKSKSEEERLWCECGKELKYQYILLDRVENQTRKLGIEHFKQHASIPENIARQILNKKYKLDEWLDDILLTVKKHNQNNGVKVQYQQVIDYFITKTNDALIEKRIPVKKGVITEKDMKLLNEFKNVGLPVPTKLYKKIEQFIQIHKDERERKEKRSEMWAKIYHQKRLQQLQKPKVSKRQNKPNKSRIYGIDKEVTNEHMGAIADCRMIIDKYLNKGKEIQFNTLYIQAREPMENLFKDFDKETVIKLIANSVERNSNNNVRVDWVSKSFIKVGEKSN